MKIILILFIVAIGYADTVFNPYNLSYRSIFHSEYERSLGKENNSTFPDESNSYLAWFNALDLHYDINNNMYMALGAKANLTLSEENYKAPFYLRGKLTSDQLDRAIISEASLNYDNDFFSVSLGRNDINYNWLLGSMDGVITSVGDDESLSLRLFWFQNFTQLQYNYYYEVKDINDAKGMYGAIGKAKVAGLDIQIYDYFLQDLRDIAGINADYTAENFSINLSYTDAKALSRALYDYDESLIQASVQWLLGRHFFELGGSLTGENGLLAMIQLGSFMSGQFYLSNQIDRENARNAYLRYLFASRSWHFELLGGATSYDNTFLAIVDNLHSYEVDAYFAYAIDHEWSLDVGLMGMNVDEADPIGVDQVLATINIGYRYELF